MLNKIFTESWSWICWEFWSEFAQNLAHNHKNDLFRTLSRFRSELRAGFSHNSEQMFLIIQNKIYLQSFSWFVQNAGQDWLKIMSESDLFRLSKSSEVNLLRKLSKVCSSPWANLAEHCRNRYYLTSKQDQSARSWFSKNT